MKKYSHSFIFLHGFTMHPDEMIFIKKRINNILPKNINIKYIFPKAFMKKITCYNNEKYLAWYDYYDPNIYTEPKINESDLIKSRKRIHKLISKEKSYHNGKSNKIFVLGYSQGCCMALDAGITYPEKLGGIIGFKGHIINYTFDSIKQGVQQNIWVCHGKMDQTIGYNVAKKSYDKYKKMGYDITFLSQNVNHGMITGIKDQMISLKIFLDKYL